MVKKTRPKKREKTRARVDTFALVLYQRTYLLVVVVVVVVLLLLHLSLASGVIGGVITALGPSALISNQAKARNEVLPLNFQVFFNC